MIRRAPALLFLCFFLSGFTGLLYQTVWVRLALAKFGVNSATVATVLSIFMAGLAVGTVLAGRYAERIEARLGYRGLQLYGVAELLIGLGGWVVPPLLDRARTVLLALGASDSAGYTMASAVLLGLTLFPFCTAMGLTFPTAVSFLRRCASHGSRVDAFSYLYLPNVAGAFIGVLVTSLVLIERFGFVTTSLFASGVNGLIAALAVFVVPWAGAAPREPVLPIREPSRTTASSRRFRLVALFVTGLSTMGMEVIWTRIYPFYIGSFVYSFAAILATYLVATALGSALYRWARRRGTRVNFAAWWPWLCLASLLPLLSVSITFKIWSPLRPLIGLMPFCFILGYVTPSLVDDEAGDDPDRVGYAYGLNLLGCVLGPLLAGFWLLPLFGTRVATISLALPLFLLFFAPAVRRRTRLVWKVAAVAGSIATLTFTTLFEDQFPRQHVLNDSAATVIAAGAKMEKHLIVNGVGMTGLTPITKMMVHFPAAHVAAQTPVPLKGLIICFGMGTSFRSMVSWGGTVTAVELIPSVPKLFGFYFLDGPDVLRLQRAHVEIDDGRRYLDRRRETFDLIALDPPPPVEAATSSLLYSREFYQSAMRRLAPNGILQAWLPGGDAATMTAVTRALVDSFPYVRAFHSVKGWGIHYLASGRPIARLTAEQMLALMPAAAVRDMTEWEDIAPLEYLRRMALGELDVRQLVVNGAADGALVLTDDRPINEFFFLRRYLTAGN